MDVKATVALALERLKQLTGRIDAVEKSAETQRTEADRAQRDAAQAVERQYGELSRRLRVTAQDADRALRNFPAMLASAANKARAEAEQGRKQTVEVAETVESLTETVNTQRDETVAALKTKATTAQLTEAKKTAARDVKAANEGTAKVSKRVGELAATVEDNRKAWLSKSRSIAEAVDKLTKSQATYATREALTAAVDKMSGFVTNAEFKRKLKELEELIQRTRYRAPFDPGGRRGGGGTVSEEQLREIIEGLIGKKRVRFVTEDYVATLADDDILLVSGETLVTIPEATPGNSGCRLRIKRIGEADVTVRPEDGTIEDEIERVLNVKYWALVLYSDGTQWVEM